MKRIHRASIEAELSARQRRALTFDEAEYLRAAGWFSLFGGWIDPILFAEEGFLAPQVDAQDALFTQRERERAEAVARVESTLEGQRAKLLGVLAVRKLGPTPLEQQRAGLLFLLERRAIRLIEEGTSV